MFGLGRWYKLAEVQPHGGGDMIAQHAAEGGVLGRVGKRFESPGDDRGSHTDSDALIDCTLNAIVCGILLAELDDGEDQKRCFGRGQRDPYFLAKPRP